MNKYQQIPGVTRTMMSYSRIYIVLQINYIEMGITNLEVISWGRSLDKFESTAVFDMAKDKTEQDKLTNV